MDEAITPKSIPISPSPLYLFINVPGPQNKSVPLQPSVNPSGTSLLKDFMMKSFKLERLPSSTPMKIKRQPLILPKAVKPIACKVPKGKVPISPTSQKIQENCQFLYSKHAQHNVDPRNIDKTYSSHGNVVLSNNLFSSTSKNLPNPAVHVGNNEMYLIPNNVGVPSSPVTPTTKLNDSQILNSVQIQSKLTIPLKTCFFLKSRDSIQHPIFINGKHISRAQRAHLSKFVPIKPKSVPPATPDFSTPSSSLCANSINNCGSIVSGNNNITKTKTVQRENGQALGKSCKRGRKSICSVVSTSPNVDSVNVPSDIQVKIERLDTSYEYRLTDSKKSTILDSEKHWLGTSSSKLDSCVTGLKQNLPFEADYNMLGDKEAMKIKTDKTEAEEERKQAIIMKKRSFRDIALIHKEDFTKTFYDKEQKNSNSGNIFISHTDRSFVVKSEMGQGNDANNAKTEFFCDKQQENSHHYNTRISYTGPSIAIKSDVGQKDDINNINNSHPFQAVSVKSEPDDSYGESICYF